MEELAQVVKQACDATNLNISVICNANKEFFSKNPKMVQRLPKEERAYWYWFLKNN